MAGGMLGVGIRGCVDEGEGSRWVGEREGSRWVRERA